MRSKRGRHLSAVGLAEAAGIIDGARNGIGRQPDLNPRIYAAMTFSRRKTALTRESNTVGSNGLMM